MAACSAGREEGMALSRLEKGCLSNAPLRGGGPGPQPPAGAARRKGCRLTHAVNVSSLPRDGPDFAGTLPLGAPGVPSAPGSGGSSASADARSSQHLSLWL